MESRLSIGSFKKILRRGAFGAPDVMLKTRRERKMISSVYCFRALVSLLLKHFVIEFKKSIASIWDFRKVFWKA